MNSMFKVILRPTTPSNFDLLLSSLYLSSSSSSFSFFLPFSPFLLLIFLLLLTFFLFTCRGRGIGAACHGACASAQNKSFSVSSDAAPRSVVAFIGSRDVHGAMRKSASGSPSA